MIVPANLQWTTPPEDSGQIVQVCYAADGQRELIWRRTYDPSTKSTTYAVAHWPEGLSWSPVSSSTLGESVEEQLEEALRALLVECDRHERAMRMTRWNAKCALRRYHSQPRASDGFEGASISSATLRRCTGVDETS